MNGFHLIANDGSSDIIVMRSDAWENVAESGDGFTTSWSDWDAWRADMDGSTVDMYVSLNGTSFSMTATITGKSKDVYTYTYNKTLGSAPASLNIRLSVHYAYLQITTADLSNTVTYDFTSYGNRTLELSKTSIFRGNSIEHYIPSNFPEANGRFGFQETDWGTTPSSLSSTNGLVIGRSSGTHVGMKNLVAHDKVKINFSSGAVMVRGLVPDFAGITSAWTSYTSGIQINMASTSNFSFQAKTSCKITSIVIETVVAETVTAPNIDSESDGDERTITITAGSSNLLSGVSTYYTTDGSDPDNTSTLYTGPFNVNETTTIKAITISSSSKATASTVTTQLIDLDVIDTPTASITAVDGINRTVTFACTTDGVTLYYSIKDGEDWGDYVAANSLVISSNTTLKVKATKSAKEAVSDELSFEAGTAIKLNNPSYSIGAYSEGAYTLTLTTTQTDKFLSPTAVIKYTVNDGEIQTINSGETVAASVGSTYKFWSYAAGYDNSDNVVVTPTYIDLSTYRTDWTNDFKALAGSIIGTGSANYNKSASLTKSGEELISGYYNITNEGFNTKFGVNDVNWQVRYYGATKDYNTGLWPYNVNGSMAITGLSAGDVIIFTGDAVTAGTNVTKEVFMSTANSNSTFVVSADGNATFTPTKSGYIYSVTVYTLRPATVSKTITSAGWATYCSPYALDFSSSITNLTKAYLVTGHEGSTLTLSPITTTIPANTGILLEGEGAVSIPVVASSLTDVSANILKGVTTAMAKDANSIYVLMNEAAGVGFYKNNNAFTVGANTAYINATDLAGARAFYLFGDETTGISLTENSELRTENAVYDLQGRRVAQPQKGLYIVNGKKVVIK